jgi:phosphopantetheinyl transferase
MSSAVLTIDIWSAPIPHNPQKDWAFMLNEADEAELNLLPFGRDQRLFVAGRALMRMALCDKLGSEWRDLRLHHDSLGRPLVSDSDLSVSMSFSADHVCVAFSGDGDIGIDIERCDPIEDLPELMAYVCAEAERSWLNQLPLMERLVAFYQLWTLKEAGLKALGIGFRQEPAQFEFACPLVRPIHLRQADHPLIFTTQFLGHLQGADICLSAAVKNKEDSALKLNMQHFDDVSRFKNLL